jgi:hypothetical protein
MLNSVQFGKTIFLLKQKRFLRQFLPDEPAIPKPTLPFRPRGV